MKRAILFVLTLALLLPGMAVNAQQLTAREDRGDYIIPLHHGSYSCRFRGETDDGSRFEIVISYQENARGEIISASVFSWKAAWYLGARWSWFAYEIYIEIQQWGKTYRKSCYASGRY